MRAARQLEEIDANQNAEKTASAGKTNALQKPLQPSEELAAVVGSGPLPGARL